MRFLVEKWKTVYAGHHPTRPVANATIAITSSPTAAPPVDHRLVLGQTAHAAYPRMIPARILMARSQLRFIDESHGLCPAVRRPWNFAVVTCWQSARVRSTGDTR